MKLVLATQNVHKIREIKAKLKKSIPFDIYSLLDFPHYNPPAEDGSTFEENALIKAKDAAKRLNMVSIADDSGIVVPALGGIPGVYSARYAGENATDKENRQKLLAAMTQLEGLERSAYFECVITLATPKGFSKSFRGLCEGTLLKKEQGSAGFGYDALFQKHDYQLTFAELTEEVKNKVSHRGKALEKLMLYLETFSFE